MPARLVRGNRWPTVRANYAPNTPLDLWWGGKIGYGVGRGGEATWSRMTTTSHVGRDTTGPEAGGGCEASPGNVCRLGCCCCCCSGTGRMSGRIGEDGLKG